MAIVSAADKHIRAVIGNDQAIFLHGAKNFLNIRVAASLRDIDISLQAQAGAHWHDPSTAISSRPFGSMMKS